MTILSIWVWAITVFGVVGILESAHARLGIASAQRDADAVALAAVARGVSEGRVLADVLGVSVVSIVEEGAVVAVTIQAGSVVASASARR